MNPFDLKGPEFLALWLAGVPAIAAIIAIVRVVVARSKSLEDPAAIAARLHPTEIGYLIGGRRRAIEAAVAGLHHRGLVELRGETLHATGTPGTVIVHDNVFRGIVTAERRSRVEEYVLERCPTTVRALEEDADMLEVGLEAKLENEGLLVGDARAAFYVQLAGWAWVLFGVVKIVIGISRDRPVAVLLILVGFGCWAVWKLARAPRLTSLGLLVERAVTSRNYGLLLTASTAPAQLSGNDMTLAYAIFGHTVAAAAVMTMMPSFQTAIVATATTSSSSSTGGCGSSCGSSCGGGCGGGCGGCG